MEFVEEFPFMDENFEEFMTRIQAETKARLEQEWEDKVRAQCEEKIRQECEERAHRELKERLKRELKESAQKEEEERIRKELEEKLRAEAQGKMKKDAEKKMQKNLEERAKKEMKKKIEEEVRERTRREMEEKMLKALQEKTKKELEQKVRKETEEKLRKEMKTKVQRDLQSKMQKEMEDKMKKEMDEKLQREIEEKLKKEMPARMQLELEERMKREMNERIQRELEERMAREMKERLQREVEERVKKELEEKMEREIEERLHRQMKEKLRRSMEKKLQQELEEKMHTELEHRVHKEMQEKLEREVERRMQRELEERFRQEIDIRVQREMQRRIQNESEAKHMTSGEERVEMKPAETQRTEGGGAFEESKSRSQEELAEDLRKEYERRLHKEYEGKLRRHYEVARRAEQETGSVVESDSDKVSENVEGSFGSDIVQEQPSKSMEGEKERGGAELSRTQLERLESTETSQDRNKDDQVPRPSEESPRGSRRASPETEHSDAEDFVLVTADMFEREPSGRSFGDSVSSDLHSNATGQGETQSSDLEVSPVMEAVEGGESLSSSGLRDYCTDSTDVDLDSGAVVEAHTQEHQESATTTTTTDSETSGGREPTEYQEPDHTVETETSVVGETVAPLEKTKTKKDEEFTDSSERKLHAGAAVGYSRESQEPEDVVEAVSSDVVKTETPYEETDSGDEGREVHPPGLERTHTVSEESSEIPSLPSVGHGTLSTDLESSSVDHFDPSAAAADSTATTDSSTAPESVDTGDSVSALEPVSLDVEEEKPDVVSMQSSHQSSGEGDAEKTEDNVATKEATPPLVSDDDVVLEIVEEGVTSPLLFDKDASAELLEPGADVEMLPDSLKGTPESIATDSSFQKSRKTPDSLSERLNTKYSSQEVRDSETSKPSSQQEQSAPVERLSSTDEKDLSGRQGETEEMPLTSSPLTRDTDDSLKEISSLSPESPLDAEVQRPVRGRTEQSTDETTPLSSVETEGLFIMDSSDLASEAAYDQTSEEAVASEPSAVVDSSDLHVLESRSEVISKEEAEAFPEVGESPSEKKEEKIHLVEREGESSTSEELAPGESKPSVEISSVHESLEETSDLKKVDDMGLATEKPSMEHPGEKREEEMLPVEEEVQPATFEERTSEEPKPSTEVASVGDLLEETSHFKPEKDEASLPIDSFSVEQSAPQKDGPADLNSSTERLQSVNDSHPFETLLGMISSAEPSEEIIPPGRVEDSFDSEGSVDEEAPETDTQQLGIGPQVPESGVEWSKHEAPSERPAHAIPLEEQHEKFPEPPLYMVEPESCEVETEPSNLGQPWGKEDQSSPSCQDLLEKPGSVKEEDKDRDDSTSVTSPLSSLTPLSPEMKEDVDEVKTETQAAGEQGASMPEEDFTQVSSLSRDIEIDRAVEAPLSVSEGIGSFDTSELRLDSILPSTEEKEEEEESRSSIESHSSMSTDQSREETIEKETSVEQVKGDTEEEQEKENKALTAEETIDEEASRERVKGDREEEQKKETDAQTDEKVIEKEASREQVKEEEQKEESEVALTGGPTGETVSTMTKSNEWQWVDLKIVEDGDYLTRPSQLPCPEPLKPASDTPHDDSTDMGAASDRESAGHVDSSIEASVENKAPSAVGMPSSAQADDEILHTGFDLSVTGDSEPEPSPAAVKEEPVVQSSVGKEDAPIFESDVDSPSQKLPDHSSRIDSGTETTSPRDMFSETCTQTDVNPDVSTQTDLRDIEVCSRGDQSGSGFSPIIARAKVQTELTKKVEQVPLPLESRVPERESSSLSSDRSSTKDTSVGVEDHKKAASSPEKSASSARQKGPAFIPKPALGVEFRKSPSEEASERLDRRSISTSTEELGGVESESTVETEVSSESLPAFASVVTQTPLVAEKSAEPPSGVGEEEMEGVGVTDDLSPRAVEGQIMQGRVPVEASAKGDGEGLPAKVNRDTGERSIESSESAESSLASGAPLTQIETPPSVEEQREPELTFKRLPDPALSPTAPNEPVEEETVPDAFIEEKLPSPQVAASLSDVVIGEVQQVKGHLEGTPQTPDERLRISEASAENQHTATEAAADAREEDDAEEGELGPPELSLEVQEYPESPLEEAELPTCRGDAQKSAASDQSGEEEAGRSRNDTQEASTRPAVEEEEDLIESAELDQRPPSPVALETSTDLTDLDLPSPMLPELPALPKEEDESGTAQPVEKTEASLKAPDEQLEEVSQEEHGSSAVSSRSVISKSLDFVPDGTPSSRRRAGRPPVERAWSVWSEEGTRAVSPVRDTELSDRAPHPSTDAPEPPVAPSAVGDSDTAADSESPESAEVERIPKEAVSIRRDSGHASDSRSESPEHSGREPEPLSVSDIDLSIADEMRGAESSDQLQLEQSDAMETTPTSVFLTDTDTTSSGAYVLQEDVTPDAGRDSRDLSETDENSSKAQSSPKELLKHETPSDVEKSETQSEVSPKAVDDLSAMPSAPEPVTVLQKEMKAMPSPRVNLIETVKVAPDVDVERRQSPPSTTQMLTENVEAPSDFPAVPESRTSVAIPQEAIADTRHFSEDDDDDEDGGRRLPQSVSADFAIERGGRLCFPNRRAESSHQPVSSKSAGATPSEEAFLHPSVPKSAKGRSSSTESSTVSVEVHRAPSGEDLREVDEPLSVGQPQRLDDESRIPEPPRLEAKDQEIPRTEGRERVETLDRRSKGQGHLEEQTPRIGSEEKRRSTTSDGRSFSGEQRSSLSSARPKQTDRTGIPGALFMGDYFFSVESTPSGAKSKREKTSPESQQIRSETSATASRDRGEVRTQRSVEDRDRRNAEAARKERTIDSSGESRRSGAEPSDNRRTHRERADGSERSGRKRDDREESSRGGRNDRKTPDGRRESGHPRDDREESSRGGRNDRRTPDGRRESGHQRDETVPSSRETNSRYRDLSSLPSATTATRDSHSRKSKTPVKPIVFGPEPPDSANQPRKGAVLAMLGAASPVGSALQRLSPERPLFVHLCAVDLTVVQRDSGAVARPGLFGKESSQSSVPLHEVLRRMRGAPLLDILRTMQTLDRAGRLDRDSKSKEEKGRFHRQAAFRTSIHKRSLDWNSDSSSGSPVHGEGSGDSGQYRQQSSDYHRLKREIEGARHSPKRSQMARQAGDQRRSSRRGAAESRDSRSEWSQRREEKSSTESTASARHQHGSSQRQESDPMSVIQMLTSAQARAQDRERMPQQTSRVSHHQRSDFTQAHGKSRSLDQQSPGSLPPGHLYDSGSRSGYRPQGAHLGSSWNRQSSLPVSWDFDFPDVPSATSMPWGGPGRALTSRDFPGGAAGNFGGARFKDSTGWQRSSSYRGDKSAQVRWKELALGQPPSLESRSGGVGQGVWASGGWTEPVGDPRDWSGVGDPGFPGGVDTAGGGVEGDWSDLLDSLRSFDRLRGSGGLPPAVLASAQRDLGPDFKPSELSRTPVHGMSRSTSLDQRAPPRDWSATAGSSLPPFERSQSGSGWSDPRLDPRGAAAGTLELLGDRHPPVPDPSDPRQSSGRGAPKSWELGGGWGVGDTSERREQQRGRTTERRDRSRPRTRDGPVSLSEGVTGMENDAGAGSGRLSNHVSASPQKPGPPHNDASKMNGTEKPVSNADNLKLKNLPLADVLAKVPEVVAELGKLEDYGRGEGMRYQKMLGDLYWDHQHHRADIGDVMAKNGYAGISIKMLKVLNTIGIFKNDDVWFPTYYTYNTLWNFSDASEQLARDLAEADAVRLLTLNCGHKPYLNAIRSKNVYYVIKASLSILHNISRIPDVKHFFKEHKTPEVIMPFITSDDDMFKALAMLTLAYIVEEEENAKLIDETGTIKNVVSWIEKAQNSTKHRYKGFSTWELAQGLDKLAVNDTNKAKIVEAGALPVFLRMLQHDDVKEQSTAARCIWTLSFDHDVRQKLVEHEGLVAELTRLQESSNTEVRKHAKGALWVIKGENDPNTSDRPRTAHKKHIFISYCWSDQKTVKQLRERLREEGYAVWIDYEQMGGSTLESMAAAIENSAVVLLGMSEKYKQSPNCRTEAEYTFTLRKEYIPLMLQQKYRPDGWLGIILGAKLFFDFSGKYPFEKSMQGLLKELRGRGQQQSNNQSAGDSVDAPIQSSELVPVHAGVKGGNPGHTTVSGTELVPHGGGHTSAVMSCDQVSQWLSAHNLHNYVRAFDQIDGELLWQLKLMRQDAPEFFYGCLQQKLAMNLVDILRFTAALDQLR